MQKKVIGFFFIFTKFAKYKENKTCENKLKAQILLTYISTGIYLSLDERYFYFVIQSYVVLSQLKLKKKIG